MVNSHTKDVTIDPQGDLLEMEEQVQPEAVSVNVLGGLRAQAAGGSITKIESLIKHDKIVAKHMGWRENVIGRFRSDRTGGSLIAKNNAEALVSVTDQETLPRDRCRRSGSVDPESTRQEPKRRGMRW